MTDIVERARQVVRCRGAYSSMEVAGLLGQLADETERLIKLWNDYRIAHESVARDNERLETEIERLRADFNDLNEHRAHQKAEIERLQADLVAANVRAGKYSAGCEQCEPLRGCLWDCRALLRGELSGSDQRAGVLKWADDLLREEGPSDD